MEVKWNIKGRPKELEGKSYFKGYSLKTIPIQCSLRSFSIDTKKIWKNMSKDIIWLLQLIKSTKSLFKEMAKCLWTAN